MKIALLGDIAVFANGLLSKDWKKELLPIKKYLNEFDLVVANLEVAITDTNQTLICKGIHLKTDKRIVSVLQYLGIKYVSLANNHIYDFGLKGLHDTISALKEAGIHYYGIRTMESAISEEYNLGFHSFCCYSANGAGYIKGNHGYVVPLTRESLTKALELDRINGRTSILSLHWGDEYSAYPNERQVRLLHELAKKYSFVVHGHHTHVMQGIEEYNSSIFAYNLGNFMFDHVESTVNKRLSIGLSKLNQESFVMGLEFSTTGFHIYSTQGIIYDTYKFELVDNRKKIDKLSTLINNYSSVEYKEESREMIRNLKERNLGKKDFKWLIGKMNYYSIGAKILSYIHDMSYKKAY